MFRSEHPLEDSSIEHFEANELTVFSNFRNGGSLVCDNRRKEKERKTELRPPSLPLVIS